MTNIEPVPLKAQDLLDAQTDTQISQRWWDWLKKFASGQNWGSGNHQDTFASGDIQYIGPNGVLLGSDNFIVGLKIPNPGGVNGPCLLLGSGFGPGGSPNPGFAWIITDQAFDNFTPGNTLGITSGETQGAGTANGGLLFLLGGASFGGTGGETRILGGTSAHGNGGMMNIQGGGATGAGVPGDCFISAGQQGTTGAVLHLLMTTLGGIPGALRIKNNSTLLYEFETTGALFIGSGINSFGTNTQAFVSGGPGLPCYWLPASTLGATSIEGILPGGIMLKVGVALAAAGPGVPVDVAVAFVTPFPTACVGIWPVTTRSVASAGQAVDGSNFSSGITRFGGTVTIDNTAGVGSSFIAPWFAIGF